MIKDIIEINNVKSDLLLFDDYKDTYFDDKSGVITPCVISNNNFKKLQFQGKIFDNLLLLPNTDKYHSNIELYEELKNYDYILFYDIKDVGTDNQRYDIYFQHSNTNLIIVYKIFSNSWRLDCVEIYKDIANESLVTINNLANPFLIKFNTNKLFINQYKKNCTLVYDDEEEI